jgi:hypothetical protein
MRPLGDDFKASIWDKSVPEIKKMFDEPLLTAVTNILIDNVRFQVSTRIELELE